MNEIFVQILNMSLTASYVILFVLIARLLLKKTPKVFSYALWGVVLFRLISPFSFESIISFLPSAKKIINIPLNTSPNTAILNTIGGAGTAVGDAVTKQATSIFSFDSLAIIWVLGIVALLIYSIVSLLKLNSKLIGAVKQTDNIYLVDSLQSPFVIGLFSPKIYLPSTLSETEQGYIILHEQTHIKHFDHIVKIIAFLAVCVHWFNPFVWIAFILCVKDMEMSCDESVIKSLGKEVKKDYSSSLLNLATGKRIFGATPLAFGEGDTKSRIKNVLNYKKPAFWVITVSIVVVVVVGIGLMADPMKSDANIIPKNDGHTSITEEALIAKFDIIMNKQNISSNPYNYVKANQKTFDEIVANGNNTLSYCFALFEKGNQTGLNGHIMMYACMAIQPEVEADLGFETGQLWYDAFKLRALALKETNSKEEMVKSYPTYALLLDLLENTNSSGETPTTLGVEWVELGVNLSSLGIDKIQIVTAMGNPKYGADSKTITNPKEIKLFLDTFDSAKIGNEVVENEIGVGAASHYSFYSNDNLITRFYFNVNNTNIFWNKEQFHDIKYGQNLKTPYELYQNSTAEIVVVDENGNEMTRPTD